MNMHLRQPITKKRQHPERSPRVLSDSRRIVGLRSGCLRDIFLLAGLILFLTACSVELSQSTSAPRPSAAAPTVTVESNSNAASPEAPAWANLNLNGQLVVITSTFSSKGVQPITFNLAKLDLDSGRLAQLFHAPDQAWVTAASISPDGQKIIIAYAPPPEPGEIQFGYSGLYQLSADGSGEPQAVLERADPKESYASPLWSPDGRYLYYVHLRTTEAESGGSVTTYAIERLTFPDGKPETVVDGAFWPRLSPDGSKLVYITYNSASFSNALYVSDADGQNPILILPSATFSAVDAPVFSPDGEAVLFSAVGSGPATSLSWLDQLFGVQIASAASSAHNVPSDWWQVSVKGEGLKRLTKLYEIGLYGAFAQDGQHLAFVSTNGLYVMEPDGGHVVPVLDHVGMSGTVSWIP
jgi:Tol biopolymer transport system component